MMNFQWITVSMTLIVLSLVHINASVYQNVRQVRTDHCPPVNLCDYVQCDNGQCAENKTVPDCFTCHCNAGYTGALCETQINPTGGCASPCLNGGQCQQNGTNTFVCVCPADYTGTQCETSVLASHPCVTMPNTVCQNGGTCTIYGNDYICTCPAGWSGTNCQTQNITSCPTDFCQTGICVINANRPYCICPATHTGERCEIVIPVTTTTTIQTITTTTSPIIITTPTTVAPGTRPCASNPCLNGGSCYNTGNTFICLCTIQYSGPTCSVQSPVTTPAPTTTSSTNACSPSPCNNGGTCFKHSTGFVCLCTSAYTGLTCDTPKTPSSTTSPNSCTSNPCQNGGTCYNTGNSYFCYCGTGSSYTGKNCESSAVQADPSCPLNCSPGYCVRAGGRQNEYACMCNGVLTPTSCLSK